MRLNFFLLPYLSTFFAFASGSSSDQNSMPAAIPDTKMSAFYLVSMQGIEIGTGVASHNELNQDAPAHFDVRLLHRVGHSALVTKYTGNLSQEKNTNKVNIRIAILDNSKEIEVEKLDWDTSSPSPAIKDGVLAKLPALLGLAQDIQANKSGQQEWPAGRFSMLFFKRLDLSQGQAAIFSPFTGEMFNDQDLKAKYDSDGFLKEASVPWYGGLHLDFMRLPQAELAVKSEKIIKSPVELSWFSTEARVREDFRQLEGDADSCLLFATDAERMVKREFPQLPYLVHRKLFNVRNLCELVSLETKNISLSLPMSTSTFAVLDKLMKPVRAMLTEDRRELPRVFVHSPEIEVLNDDSRRWQWLKIISHLIQKTHQEMAEILAIEESQKVNVVMKINIDKLTQGSIAKGTLRLQSSSLSQTVELAVDKNMRPKSWTAIPNPLAQSLKLAVVSGGSSEKLSGLRPEIPFELINGQTFALGGVMSLGTLCAHFNGRVGLDLGNSDGRIFTSQVVRGVWDISSRLDLVREFARRATANPDCKNLVVRVPPELFSATEAELNIFRKDILQTESEFQITNGGSRRMRMAPGTYELVLSSLINGNVLGKRLIIIPEGRENLQVNTNIH